MTTHNLPSIDGLKSQAKRLRSDLAKDGDTISHSRSLELIARQHGFRDWNTIHAAARDGKTQFSLGMRVSGQYLGRPFTGEISGLRILHPTGRYELTVEFDEAVDVVTFDSFSSFRKRVTAVIGSDGRTAKKTSNGVPHMVLDI